MAITASVQVRALAKAVAAAFAAATLTEEERHPPRIHHTDLPWACPPLITSLVLDRGALQDHFDAPLDTTPAKLHRFWVETLRQMWHEPSRVLKKGAYANLGAAMPTVKLGQRALRFSAPIGAPSQIHESAAVMLSLEVAHAAVTSFAVKDVYTSDDDYIVTLPDGMRFGVEGGRPLVDSPWTYDASGQVTDLLLGARGEISYACHYDQIAAVRSVLHSHPGRFPHNFDALDQALQALRYLTLGGYCPELTCAMIVSPQEALRHKEVEAALYAAIDVVRSPIPDRNKLQTLRDGLVPTAMSLTTFRREVFSGSTFPFSMAAGKAEQIEARLVELYQSKVPTGLQRPL